MLLSGHQPVYLPGIILFAKLAISDAFMFVGHAQFSNKSWHSRNQIRLGDSELTLSVPVQKSGRFGQSIDDTRILDGNWQRKHLGSIRQAYGRRPYFDAYFPELEQILLSDQSRLGALNTTLIRRVCAWLAIETPIVESRAYAIEGAKTEMLISMCRAVRADSYLSNEGSRVYVDERRMFEAGIRHWWLDFRHPVYEQGREFRPNMSVIDILFNLGPAAGEIVKSSARLAPGEFSEAR